MTFFSKNLVFAIDSFSEILYSIIHIAGCSAAGSASGLGPGCRRFKSCHPDKKEHHF